MLPREFIEELGTEFETAFRDRHRDMLAHPRLRERSGFWLRELAGLGLAAYREHRDIIHREHNSKRRVNPARPRRELQMFSSFKQDFVFALRMTAKTPIVTAIAVVSLAIGVAANTTTFSLLHGWLLKPLPYPNAERLVMAWENDLLEGDDQEPVAPANFFDWMDETTSFEEWIGWQYETANLTDIERPEQLTVATVTPNYFSVLDAVPMLGRTFQPDEGGADDVAALVMGETIWRTRFGASPDVIGSTVTLDGARYTVLGVMPETFDFLLGNVSMWIASDFRDHRYEREDQSLFVTALLKRNISVDQAQSEMTAVSARLAELYPETNENSSVNVETVREVFPGPTDKSLTTILMSIVALVLLVACVNVSSLLMAKTEARQREIGVRVALGAGKARLTYQLLTESIVLASMAGALGVVLSIFGIKGVAAAMPPELPVLFQPRLSGPVLGFGVVVSLLTGLTFGIGPAMHAVGGGSTSALVDGSRGGTISKHRRRLRSGFVIAEFALALTTLMAAGVLTDLFHQRLDISPGFDADHLIKTELALPEYKYPDDESIVAFVGEIERQLETVPRAAGFTLANVLPRTRSIPTAPFTVDGREYGPDEEPSTGWIAVGADYFDVMGIRLRSGRAFTPGDREGTPPVVLVNQRWVEQFAGGESPIGRRITVQGESREIVGVVNNIAQARLTGLLPHDPMVYFPMAQRPVRSIRIVMRADGDPNQLVLPLQNAVWAVDKDLPVALTQTVESYMEMELAGPTVMTQMLVIVGGLTLALAAIGIYGLMAYSVSQRTREIGIRMALGAHAGRVVARVTRQGATLAGMGLLIGAPFAAIGLRIINSMITQGASADEIEEFGAVVAFAPMATIAALLVVVGLVASYLPARRVTKVNPVTALGVE